MMKNIIVKNLKFAFISQIISLMVSLMMAFVVPKIIGVSEYAMWQLFILFHGYSGLLLFGYNDGIYLILGGKNYLEIERNEISSQIKIVIITLCLILILFATFVMFLDMEINRKFIFMCVIIYTLIYNVMIIFGYIFQATNNTYWYSTALLISKLIFLFFLIFSFVIQVTNYKVLILVYLGSQFISSVYTLIKGKDLLKGRFIGVKKTFRLILTSVKIGITLMLAYYSGSLILGYSKLMIERKFGLTIFGLVSFSISLISILLLFISQISLVMFPALRKVDFQKQVDIYRIFRDILYLLFPIVFLSILPMQWIVKLWLPDYIVSLKYLIILLPIALFEMRSNLLGVTFLKIWNKPSNILVINLISLIITLILITIFITLNFALNIILIIVVIILFTRSLLFEFFTFKLSKINQRKYMNVVIEISSIIVFYLMYLFFGNDSIAYYYLFLLIVIVINYKQYKNIIAEVINLRRR